MNHEQNNLITAPNNGLYNAIADILVQAHGKVYHAVNFTMVQAYWEIGRLITEDELHGQRADYGKEVLKQLSKRLTQEFGKEFDERELRKMCQFYRSFPIRDTLRPELTWSHYRRLLSVENGKARQWYMNEAAKATWSTVSSTDSKQMFAAKYVPYLPTEEELGNEVKRILSQ